MIPRVVGSVFGSLGAYLLWKILNGLYAELTSPLRYLPGPKSSHWFYGNLLEVAADEHSGLEERYVKEYGRTFKYHWLFGKASLYTTDAKAVHHFLSNTEIYQKSPSLRFSLSRVVGPGVLVMEGDAHKKQRKIMNPAFGAPQIRELTEIFVEKSIQLRNIWAAQATRDGGTARVEIVSWLSKATLDIIGLAGFNYNINALGAEHGDTPDELAEAFETVVKSETGFNFFRLLQVLFPVLQSIPVRPTKSQATIMRIGRKLLADSKQEIKANGTFETGRARDLLNLLVRANTSKDIPANQQLSDEDVIAQVPTFLVAGHETTSTAVTWALFALTQNKAAQTRLREELLNVSTETPDMEELNALPYLDWVVRETLRVHAPVPSTSRIAMRDDVVQLGTPFTDSKGKVQDSVRVRKGDSISIPILALNRDAEIWGPDAMEFVPERWETAASNNIPGIWGHMLTFIGGPRSCIGFRFSLIEMKALLFTLIRGLEFELAVPIEDIGKKSTAIVQLPIVRSEPAAGNQMPLLVRPVVR
ncbi:cytochrome P450 [Mycena metata]|uniref:Cytochrome P450 n=1 Tax=Mycena metata TaxID=1033252 RepID=A0AAD7HE43_9AGAR|nr:cytochrome P450 [Mycena metata]